ncbi:MAG TPA: 2-phosphosulfolactate phosphatase [Methylomirabilota bacterium]|nr:2-phosphosulfolactate phosphatase [Methylomirabilota bacterium]
MGLNGGALDGSAAERSGAGMSYEDQRPFTARFDWGAEGLRALAADVSVVVIVDVLSFSTAVSVAVGAGGAVIPCPWHGDEARRLAASRGALLAVLRSETRPHQPYSLSPATLRNLPSGSRLVLPSPNGSRLSAMADALVGNVLVGCLRNAGAVAGAARKLAGGDAVAVIAAGERRLGGEGSMRPAVEDLVGAGAVLAALHSERPSPEAVAAIAAFRAAAGDLPGFLAGCASGRELIDAGFPEDVAIAAERDVDQVAPVLRIGIFGPR